EELERERDTLDNISQLKAGLAAIADALGNEMTGACETLRKAYDEADSLTGFLSDTEELAERLESCRLEVEDIRETVEGLDDSLSPDPRRLEAVEERLEAIYDLERHHRVDTIKQLLDVAENLRNTLDTLDNSDFRLKELETEAKSARKEALTHGTGNLGKAQDTVRCICSDTPRDSNASRHEESPSRHGAHPHFRSHPHRYRPG
ncbi:MAG: hypothetical protein K2F62_00020, partial [Muribaculaceae bacterium]|nr:hypothetical protein [Muribaculaceae bacterium]